MSKPMIRLFSARRKYRGFVVLQLPLVEVVDRTPTQWEQS